MKLYERETFELKEIYTPDLKKEIVAFANTNGGTIYIGVWDSREIIGVDNADFVMQQISNSLRDSIRPDVSMFSNIELLQEENNRMSGSSTLRSSLVSHQSQRCMLRLIIDKSSQTQGDSLHPGGFNFTVFTCFIQNFSHI